MALELYFNKIEVLIEMKRYDMNTTYINNSSLKQNDESILIVEDDKYMNETMQELLEDEGYKVDASSDVISAVNKIKYSDKRYKLLILDYNLQFLSRVNGLDIFELAKQKYPGIMAILISAYTDRRLIEKARQAGVAVFIGKPFRISDFINAVAQVSRLSRNGGVFISLN